MRAAVKRPRPTIFLLLSPLGSVCRDMSGPLALLDAGNDDPPQALPPFDDVYTSHAAKVYRFCFSGSIAVPIRTSSA